MVIETLGKFSHIAKPGWFLTIPVLQSIPYVIDVRELVIDVNKQHAYTLDNVQISIAAQLYLQITDVYKACYNVEQPLVAVISHTQSAMRTSVGKNDLDHLLKDRKSINKDVNEALSLTETHWGIKVLRVEITELTPDANIAEAMDLQAKAERERRQTEKNAEAKKRAVELEAEGYKNKMVLEAEGKAKALLTETSAQVESVKMLKDVGLNNSSILSYQTTLKYIDGLYSLAQKGKHSTMFIGKDVSNADVFTKSILPKLTDDK
jgi:regulator of protease activity HflC (stomatin/prohibitin superfamily)